MARRPLGLPTSCNCLQTTLISPDAWRRHSLICACRCGGTDTSAGTVNQLAEGYHAHESELQPYCKQDLFLPDFGQSSICEYNLWHPDPIGWVTSSSPSSPPQSKVSTGLAAKRATGSNCKHRRSDRGGRYLRCYRQLQRDNDPRQLDLFRELFPLAAAHGRN